MKRKINFIFPFVLALLIAGLRFYAFETHEQSDAPFEVTFYTIWVIPVFVIHNLWYLIWLLWDIQREYRNWQYLLKLIFFAAGSVGVLIWNTLTQFEQFDFFSLVRTSLGAVLFLAIQYRLKTQGNIARLQVEKEQIQSESYKAQLQVLHAKIDPHFLFNSLNTLRSMVRQKHDHAEQFILSLSDFYRQSLRYSEEIKLSVSKELKVLEAYLFLMKKRNEEAVLVNINIDPNFHSYSLPTLALQIVVENCFKHNSMTSSMPLHIEIIHIGNGYIQVQNNVQPKLGMVESTGNGLDLLIKRYQLLGIDDGVLVDRSAEKFIVQLKLIH